MTSTPLVSIITSVLNDERGLSDTLRNIPNFNYAPIEYIVIDGGSTDSTLEVIRHAGGTISKWISEPDQGIYDAWNKGVRLATGQYVAFLGAGDTYVSGGLEKLVACALANPDADFISSKLAIVCNGRIKRVLGDAWQWKIFRRYMNTVHPGSLHSRRLFDSYGEFDSSYRIAGDYEFLLRPREALKTAYVGEITVNMAAGGVSYTGYRVFYETEAAKIKNRAVTPWIARIDRYIAQFKRWVRRNIID